MYVDLLTGNPGDVLCPPLVTLQAKPILELDFPIRVTTAY